MTVTNAKVNIDVGVQVQSRITDERFCPTRVWNSSFNVVTDLSGYATVVSSLATKVFAEVAQARSAGLVTYTHVGIRLDNATHPTPALGVIPLAKAHIDGQLADGDFPDATTLQTLIINNVEYLAEQAKYLA